MNMNQTPLKQDGQHPAPQTPLLPLTVRDSPISPSNVSPGKPPSSRSSKKKKTGVLRRVGRRFLAGRRNEPSMSDYGALVEEGESGELGNSPVSSLIRQSLRSRGRSSSETTNTTEALDNESMVGKFERFLRPAVLLLGAYWLGASYPRFLELVTKVEQYLLVAWFTCVGIFVATFLQEAYKQWKTSRMRERWVEGEEQPLLPRLADEGGTVAGPVVSSEGPALPMVHPSLDPLFIVDMDQRDRIYPNGSKPFRISNEYFEGIVMVLIRTPDVDDSRVASTDGNRAAVDYFRDKQRRFEFQFQIRLKKVPTGRVYFATELQEPVRLGLVQRAFVGAAMAFVKSSSSSFHYSVTGSTDKERVERPHMAFAVEEGMNRVVATPPGQEPPRLGGVLEEDPESLKQRKKGLPYQWNTRDIYTLSLWSAYVDFLQWRCINLPGIRPFGLSNVIGKQPIELTLYEIPGEKNESTKHWRSDMKTIVRLEMSNSLVSNRGPGAEQYLSDHKPGSASRAVDSRNGTGRGEEDDEFEGVVEDPNNEMVPLVEDDNDAAAAELGEGIYVRDGDSICLRELTASGATTTAAEEDVLDYESSDRSAQLINGGSSSCYVTNGAGFAVLQERGSATIIIQKAGKSKSRSKRQSTRSRLIKNGDTVVFKLVTRKGRKGGNDETEVRYLSIHRGWWLKWVSLTPTMNGLFTVHTSETDYGLEERQKQRQAGEAQSPYLTLGGSFYLRHKRWDRYFVGVAATGSAAYGGRILGLYRPPENSEGLGDSFHGLEPNQTNEERDQDPEVDEPKGKTEWMRPLQLQAFESSAATFGLAVSVSAARLDRVPSEEMQDHDVSDGSGSPKLIFDKSHLHMDVPVWIDVMNRSERVRQLVYAVRVQKHEQLTDTYSSDDDSRVEDSPAFVRLRTGRDLAPIVRVGLKWRGNMSGGASARPRGVSTDGRVDKAVPETPTGRSSRSLFNKDELRPEDYASSDADDDNFSDDEVGSAGALEDPESAVDRPTPRRQRKGRIIMGKIASKVKATTSFTSKSVVRQSVKVGSRTVTAGKAIIAPMRPKNPPLREPKSAKRQGKRRLSQGLDLAVRKRSMMRMERAESWTSVSVVAGEFSAPDQSCRTVSAMLSRMSSLPSAMPMSSFSAMLASQVATKSEQDKSFLQGGAIELGVVPIEEKSVLFDCLVVRCLWESHWCEEWFGLYNNRLAFYTPLTSTPSIEVLFEDVRSVRLHRSHSNNPLPGCPILIVETAWLCHYVAFASDGVRQTMFKRINEALDRFNPKTAGKVAKNDLWKAHFWEGFQDSVESSKAIGNGKWADVSSGPKSKSRVVLNSRRMAFDLSPEDRDVDEVVAELLSMSLSFSFDSLKANPETLVRFLDGTSQLRLVALDELDLSAAPTFCLFTNLYHCLLQHSLLMTVNGPLHKRSCPHFMRTACYEIGGDIFSLAELQQCVIRGDMARPQPAKPPYIEVPKKANAHKMYALGFTDRRVNFVVNTGDLSCPVDVPILNPEHLETQLNVQTAAFVRRNVSVDSGKRVVVIPRVCDVYRSDFTRDSEKASAASVAMAGLQYCLRFLDEPLANEIHTLLKDEASVNIRYQPHADQYHPILRRRRFEYEEV